MKYYLPEDEEQKRHTPASTFWMLVEHKKEQRDSASMASVSVCAEMRRSDPCNWWRDTERTGRRRSEADEGSKKWLRGGSWRSYVNLQNRAVKFGCRIGEACDRFRFRIMGSFDPKAGMGFRDRIRTPLMILWRLVWSPFLLQLQLFRPSPLPI